MRALEALLEHQGSRTGAFLSPHLTSVLERVRIDGQTVGEELFLTEANRLVQVCAATGHQPTFFEILFLLAGMCHRSSGVGYGIYEVGLGGRLDATNLIQPEVTVVATIDLEHTAQLGSTLDQIAREKAGILKPRIPAVLGPGTSEATTAILEVARDTGAPVRLLGRDFEAVREPVRSPGERFEYRGGPLSGHYELGPVGAHQIENAALALAAAEALGERQGLKLDPDAAAGALSTLRLPGRLELFGEPPRLILDAAHTPCSGAALSRTLDERFPNAPIHLVVAFLEGKPVEQILDGLLPRAESIRVTRLDSPRAQDPEQIARLLGRDAVAVDSPEAALSAALDQAAPGEPVVITGSFYLVGNLREAARRLA